jgi:sterol 3beta-glucosyltransferase
MVTSYPRADETGRIRPIRCVLCKSPLRRRPDHLVSTVSKLEPFDPEHPNDFYVVYETANGVERTHMSVDTEQSAMQWRRAFEGALFRHAHAIWKQQHARKSGTESSNTDEQWTMMRACVPLDRIRVSGMQDYHSFVTLLGLEIDLRDVDKVDFSPENDLGGDSDHEDHIHQHPDHAHQQGRPTMPERTESPTTMSSKEAAQAPEIAPSESVKCPINRRFSSHRSTKSSDLSHNPPSSPGIETPTKKFSLLNSIEKAFSPSHSRDPSPSRKIPTGPQWLDSTIPKPLAKAGGVTSGKPEDWNQAGPESEYSFNIAVQQEQTWFVGSLQSAVQEAKQRRYKQGAKRPKMVLNVAGYDCLMTDEDQDHENSLHRHSSHSSDSGEEHLDSGELGPGNKPGIHPSSLRVKAARKAEKATMAAKVFGMKEEDGLWRES